MSNIELCRHCGCWKKSCECREGMAERYQEAMQDLGREIAAHRGLRDRLKAFVTAHQQTADQYALEGQHRIADAYCQAVDEINEILESHA